MCVCVYNDSGVSVKLSAETKYIWHLQNLEKVQIPFLFSYLNKMHAHITPDLLDPKLKVFYSPESACMGGKAFQYLTQLLPWKKENCICWS